jgi:dienelactone hydrolase
MPIRVFKVKKMIEELDKLPFSSKNAYRLYENMHHGWAGARADLENEENKKEFGDVYSRLAGFLKNTM